MRGEGRGARGEGRGARGAYAEGVRKCERARRAVGVAACEARVVAAAWLGSHAGRRAVLAPLVLVRSVGAFAGPVDGRVVALDADEALGARLHPDTAMAGGEGMKGRGGVKGEG